MNIKKSKVSDLYTKFTADHSDYEILDESSLGSQSYKHILIVKDKKTKKIVDIHQLIDEVDIDTDTNIGKKLFKN